MAHPWKPNQVAAIELLGRRVRPAQAAAEVGVSLRTVMRWLAIPEFRSAVDREASDLAGMAREGWVQGRQYLLGVVEGVEVPDRDRIRAAIAVSPSAATTALIVGIDQDSEVTAEQAREMRQRLFAAVTARGD